MSFCWKNWNFVDYFESKSPAFCSFPVLETNKIQSFQCLNYDTICQIFLRSESTSDELKCFHPSIYIQLIRGLDWHSIPGILIYLLNVVKLKTLFACSWLSILIFPSKLQKDYLFAWTINLNFLLLVAVIKWLILCSKSLQVCVQLSQQWRDELLCDPELCLNQNELLTQVA